MLVWLNIGRFGKTQLIWPINEQMSASGHDGHFGQIFGAFFLKLEQNKSRRNLLDMAKI